ncbi:MAG: protein kinase, partial [Defluviitaleaceae bacterium]|nr:protein kinase [Defluviitaleaceae bacterium]
MKFCTNCGNECKLDMKFCARCGSKLVESEAIAPPPSEETAEAVEVVEAPSVTTNPPAQEEMTEHNDEDASVTNDTDADVSDTYDANNATDIGSSDGEGEAIDVGANDMRDFDMSSAPLQVLPSDDSVVDAESDAEDAEDNSPPVASSLSDESHSVEPSLSKPLPAPVFSSANAPVSSFSPVGAAEDAGLLHLEDGTILQGDYVVGKLLGAGSFGATYAGWDRAGNQAIAIREYLPAEFATRVQSQISVFNDSRKQKQFHDGLVKFLEEAKQISKLQGEDGVISIYDYFEANNTAYIVMEHLEGSLLSEKPNRKFDPTVAVDFMMPIINSLEMLHDAGIYHLDIAPNNVFMTLDGRVKLIDFSAYRHVTTSHSRSLSVLVKAGFSAEELYRSNGDLGAHTDV